MTRFLALFAALLLTSLSVASACSAQASQPIRFALEGQQRGDREIQVRFSDDGRAPERSDWSTGFKPHELAGLDVVGFRAAGQRPLRFALAREAGRLDCSGQGGSSYASGTCAFTPNPAFLQLLQRSGIATPTREQQFSLMAVDARRDTIEAVAAARYPTPTINQLVELAALNVSGDYIRGLARVGFRPSSLSRLVEFKALGITPEYVGGFVRSGHANMDPDALVQFRALNITPDFVTGFERLGYTKLSASDLVQLKAVGVTPAYVASLQRAGFARLPVDKLVQMKAIGISPTDAAALRN